MVERQERNVWLERGRGGDRVALWRSAERGSLVEREVRVFLWGREGRLNLYGRRDAWIEWMRWYRLVERNV